MTYTQSELESLAVEKPEELEQIYSRIVAGYFSEWWDTGTALLSVGNFPLPRYGSDYTAVIKAGEAQGMRWNILPDSASVWSDKLLGRSFMCTRIPGMSPTAPLMICQILCVQEMRKGGE